MFMNLQNGEPRSTMTVVVEPLVKNLTMSEESTVNAIELVVCIFPDHGSRPVALELAQCCCVVALASWQFQVVDFD